MTLYEIDRALLDLVDPETGEVLDFEAFASLQMAREDKLDNVALWIKNLAAEAEAIDAEAHKLLERRDACRRKRDRLKAYLQEALAGEKRSTPQYAISYRSSEAVEIEDEAQAAAWLYDHGHSDYVNVRTCVSKSALKDLLKSGAEVPGAALVKRQSMTIR